MFKVFAVNLRGHFQNLVFFSLQEASNERLNANKHSVVVTGMRFFLVLVAGLTPVTILNFR